MFMVHCANLFGNVLEDELELLLSVVDEVIVECAHAISKFELW